MKKPWVKKTLTVTAVVFVVSFVAFRPTDAAYVVKVLGATAVEIFEGMGDFFSSLTS